MPVAVVAGLTREHLKRIRTAAKNASGPLFNDWVVEWVPARGKQYEISDSDIAEILTLAASSGAHILGVSRQAGQSRKAIAGRIRPYFRFRWLPDSIVQHTGAQLPQFFADLNAILVEESAWARIVKPKNVESPLLLPCSCFAARKSCRDLWETAEQYGDIAVIAAMEQKISTFKFGYWKRISRELGRRWIDDGYRMFDHTGPRHGVAPLPRNWKHSFEIPPGFHFDVTSTRNSGFSLMGDRGRERWAREGCHLNVDPHGYIR